jgi:hypothetical protein
VQDAHSDGLAEHPKARRPPGGRFCAE